MPHSRTQQVPNSCGLAREVVALRHAGSGAGGLGIQLGRALQVTGALVQVGRHRRVPGHAGVHGGERRQPRARPVGLAAAAIELGLVDELRMFRNPVVVGGGTPFLPPVTEDVPLDLVETRTFGSRVIYERYGRASR